MSGTRFKFIIINTIHHITSAHTHMIDISTLIQTQLDHHLQAPPGKFDPFFPESALFTLIKYANTILFIINLKRVPAPPIVVLVVLVLTFRPNICI